MVKRVLKRGLRFVVVFALMASVSVGSTPTSADASILDTSFTWPTQSDGYTRVPVCIDLGSSAAETRIGTSEPNPSLDVVVGKVRDALRTSWEAHSSVRFVGWEMCPGFSPFNAVRLLIHPDAGNRSRLGTSAVDGQSEPGTSFKPWGNGMGCIGYQFFRDPQAEYRFDCAEQYAIHEFGHVLAFEHEWHHPLTPQDCRDRIGAPAVKQPPRYQIVNPGQYDWDSVMTYVPECADVTGVRFGSETLTPIDALGVATGYGAAPTVGSDVIGVIPESGQCPDVDEVVIYMDSENSNDPFTQTVGWTGSITTPERNTRLVFCRVDSEGFGRLGARSSGSSNYAVLKLGSECPAGATEFVRVHDDENGLKESRSWMAGPVGPNRQIESDGRTTELHWCLFRETELGLDGGDVNGFPDLGFEYGVLAAGDLFDGTTIGSIQIDDEDDGGDNNDNDLRGADAELSSADAAAIATFLEDDRNTIYHVVKVAPRRFEVRATACTVFERRAMFVGFPVEIDFSANLCGVPSNATAVTLDVMVFAGNNPGNLRMFPSGQLGSGGIVNFAPDKPNSNTVTVPLSAAGSVTIAENTPGRPASEFSNWLTAKVIGWHGASGTLEYVPITPCAVLDTRANQGATGQYQGPFTVPTATLPVAVAGAFPASQGGTPGGCGIPSDASAVLANVVGINSNGTGELTLHGFNGFFQTPYGIHEYAEFSPPMDNGNALPVRLRGGQMYVSSLEGSGSTQLRVVALGYYTSQTQSTGLRFRPMAPCVAFDTRENQGAAGYTAGPRSGGQETVYDLGRFFAEQGGNSPSCTVPASAVAVEINIVALNAIRKGNVRAFPYGSTPTGGVLNFGPLNPAMNNSNSITVPVSSNRWLSIVLNGGTHGAGLPLADVRGVVTGYWEV